MPYGVRFKPRMIRAALAICIAASISLTLSSNASAASASVMSSGACSWAPCASYTAAPGERNDLTATATRATTFSDPGAAITTGAPCTAIDAHSATCPALSIFVDAGDMDDTVAVDSVQSQPDNATVTVVAGPGDDIVHAGGAIAALFGGPGDDALYGTTRQQEEIQGGPGDDLLVSGKNTSFLDGQEGQDRFVCGPGPNWIFGPARDEFIPSDCDFVSGGFADMTPYPMFLKHGVLWFRGGACPVDDDEEAPPQHCAGVLRVTERHGRHRLIARGRFGGADDLPFEARLRSVGRHLAGRRHGVLAIVSLRAESSPLIGVVRSAWTIRLCRCGSDMPRR